VELAFQHRAERGDRHDLVLLDTGTGVRRRLAGPVTYDLPRWSADGRRVRFEQRPGGGRFVLREVDVETGAIEDVPDDRPDGALLPEGSDHALRSPDGRWIGFRHPSCLLGVASADGAEVFVIVPPFAAGSFAADAYWSPCGTRLAATLTAGDDSGVHVVDLRTGGHRRVSADPRCHVSGWSPDGAWIAVTRNRPPGPATRELDDLWLLAADGSAERRLTGDGRSRRAAIRPASSPPVGNGEHELTFEWARRLRSAADRPTAGEALSARIGLDPLAVLVTVRGAEGLRHPVIDGLADIPDAFVKLDAFLREHDYRPGEGFTVVLPRFVADELRMLTIAHLVLAETKQRLWQFDRG